jgi:hypothetical protein
MAGVAAGCADFGPDLAAQPGRARPLIGSTPNQSRRPSPGQPCFPGKVSLTGRRRWTAVRAGADRRDGGDGGCTELSVPGAGVVDLQCAVV